MKKILILLVAVCFAIGSIIAKDVQVKGYTRKDGTYIAPHTRTSPNKTTNDNYSTNGNVNPYTGKEGTKPRDVEQQVSASNNSNTSPEKDAIVTPSEKAPVIGWLAMKSGLPESELKRQLGFPRLVDNKGTYEVWRYVTGTVWLKEGKVVAWMQVILN